METDERHAPAGSAGRRRRRTTDRVHSRRGSNFRLRDDVAAALEGEARATGKSKVLIVEELLARRYRLPQAA